MKFWVGFLLLFFLVQNSFAQKKIRNHFFKQHSFEKYLYAQMPEFKALLDSPTVYRTQIYFSKIKRNKNGKIHFTDYHFKKHNLYYYPASCVKLPIILKCLYYLNIYHYSLDDKLFIEDSSYCGFAGQTEIKNGWSFADYIKRMLVVSNNICFNPLYDFQYGNNTHYNQYPTQNIQQRFNHNCDSTSNATRFAFRIINSETGLTSYFRQKQSIKNHPLKSDWATAGLRYLDEKDSLINRPKSFANANYISLKDLHWEIKSIPFRFSSKLKQSDSFLLKYMSIYPSECKHPSYDAKEYPDNWGKYLLVGDDTTFHKNTFTPSPSERAGVRLDSIRIFNKVGMAYGFLTDCAYIVDYKNEVEFVISASIFVDRDGTLNDGKYAYKEIGLPFLSKLGKVLMQYELHHKRHSKFNAPRIIYED